ncbi:LysR family transcriptional regulator [Phaeovulum sp.]|uniref:LysR family transcriptional regulator n=1 Tax=Phaeovulum sp. TaxID=2934796 RepID=UPI0039E5A7D6
MRYTLDEIETFPRVMELGAITAAAAAARVNLSKSVVSKRISDLEPTLGVALFRRNAGPYHTNGMDLHRFHSGQVHMLDGPLFEGHG